MLVLDRLGALADRNARLSDEHVAGIRQTLTAAREAADSETARFRAGLEGPCYEPEPKGRPPQAAETTWTSAQLGATFAEPPLEADP